MTKAYSVSCDTCGTTYQDNWWLCTACGGSLVVTYAQPVTVRLPLKQALGDTSSLPVGSTPLVPLGRLSEAAGLELWGKCEFLSFTGSFKDRGSVVEIAKARELGKRGVVCASTGNMAASLAAYAARAGLLCTVVVPIATPENKLQQAARCGAQLVRVEGTYDDCVSVAEEIAVCDNLLLCGDYVLRREGQKSIGWELAGNGFDGFVVPVGNGTLGIATARGLGEAGEATPKFIGVQPVATSPIERAWRTGTPIQPQAAGATSASACNVGRPLDGALTIKWVQATNGQLLSVSEAAIKDAQKQLAQLEGLYVEAAGAVGLAGILANRNQFRNQKLVLILTGTGLKES